MFGFLTRKRPVSATAISDHRVQELISAYGAILEERTGGPRSETELPARKPEMDAAVLRAIELTPHGDARQHLRNGYLWLSDFQPMTAEEIAACRLYDAAINQPGDGSVADAKGRALAISETGDVVARFAAAALKEMEARVATLQSRFGDK